MLNLNVPTVTPPAGRETRTSGRGGCGRRGAGSGLRDGT
jgi:hypothetical protein